MRKRPQIKSDDYKAFITKGIIDHETKYICSSYIDAVNNSNNDDDDDDDDGDNNNDNYNNNNNKDEKEEAEYDEEDDVVDNNEELIRKCIDLGKEIREPIISDIKGIKILTLSQN